MFYDEKHTNENKSFKMIKKFAEFLNESEVISIGPYVFSEITPEAKLKEIWAESLNNYSTYISGMRFSKSEYKKAYIQAEKILKDKGIKRDDLDLYYRLYIDRINSKKNESSNSLNEGVFTKTTKRMPEEEATRKHKKIMNLIRQKQAVGFCQYNDEHNGSAFLYIKTDSDLKYDIDEILRESQVINEGQFSWFTMDTNDQIGCERENRIPVYMFDNQGNRWEEKNYEGYGEFGGKDYYDLVATMNGYEENREIGIDLAFGKKKSKTSKNTLFPALVSNKNFDWKNHNFAEEAERDPDQGWLVDIEDDRFGSDDGYYDEDDPEYYHN